MFKILYNNKYKIFVVIAIVYILVYFHRVSMSAISGNLMEDINLSASELGLISSIYFLSYAMIQPLIGFLTDKYGPSRVILVSFSATCLASIMFGLIDSFNSALISRIIIGISTGGIFIPSLKLLAQWFTASQFTRVNGLFIGLGNAGAILATAPLSYMEYFLGWRNVFFLLAVAGFSLVVAIFLLVKDKNPEDKKQKRSEKNKINYPKIIKKLVFSRNFLIFELMLFTSIGLYMTFQGLWATRYLTGVFAISPQFANTLIFFLPLGFLVGAPVSGILIDKIFHDKITLLRCAFIVQFLCWLAITFGIQLLSPLMLPGLFLLMGFSIGLVPPLIFTFIKESMPPQAMGLSLGLTVPAVFVGSFTFQLLTSIIIDFYAPGEAFHSASYFVMMVFCSSAIMIVTLSSLMLDTGRIRFSPSLIINNVRKLYNQNRSVYQNHQALIKIYQEEKVTCLNFLKQIRLLN
jgi:sugar phosphate permease